MVTSEVGYVSPKELRQLDKDLFGSPDKSRPGAKADARRALKSIFGGGKKKRRSSDFAPRFVQPIPKDKRLENLEKARRAKRLKA